MPRPPQVTQETSALFRNIEKRLRALEAIYVRPETATSAYDLLPKGYVTGFASNTASASYSPQSVIPNTPTDMAINAFEAPGTRRYRISVKSFISQSGGTTGQNTNAEFGVYIDGTYYELIGFNDDYPASSYNLFLNGWVLWEPAAGTYDINIRLVDASGGGLAYTIQFGANATRTRRLILEDIGALL